MTQTLNKAIAQSKEALPSCTAASEQHIRVVSIIFEPGNSVGNRCSKMFVVSFCKKPDGDAFRWELEAADEKPLYHLQT